LGEREIAMNDLSVKNLRCEDLQNPLGLNTGFVSVPFILDVLTRNGRKDVAYKILFQTVHLRRVLAEKSMCNIARDRCEILIHHPSGLAFLMMPIVSVSHSFTWR
jgi:hypothetical protein